MPAEMRIRFLEKKFFSTVDFERCQPLPMELHRLNFLAAAAQTDP